MSLIKIKRSTTTLVPSSLAEGELAYSELSDKLFIGKSGNNMAVIGGSGEFAKVIGQTFIDPEANTPSTSDNSNKLATTQYVKAQGYITSNAAITVSGDATGTGTTSIALTLADTGVVAGDYYKVNVDSKGRVLSGYNALVPNDIPVLTSAKISDFNTQVRINRLDQLAMPQATVDMNNQRLTGLPVPTQNSDAATKQYVDYVAQGLDVKQSVLVATTENISLNDVQTIDNVTLTAGERVLVKNQTNAVENGIYVVVAGGAWVRSNDCNNSGVASVTSGVYVFVETGDIGIGTGWVITTPNSATYSINNVPAIELGVQAIHWTQFNGAGGVTSAAGPGLWINSGELSVGAGPGIEVTANAVQISATYAGQTSINTIGTVTTGTWKGTAIDVAYGGTGNSSLSGILKGNGTSAIQSAVAGVDFLAPESEIDGGTF
jgi:hypothetical protein